MATPEIARSATLGRSAAVPLQDVEMELRKRHAGGFTVGVAVDGSQMSDRAAQVAANFVNLKRGDKLAVMHVADKSKGYLPRHLQPTHLKNYYEDLAATSSLGLQAEWVCREKEEGQTTCAALMKMADKRGVDLLVLGSFGRKGEKIDLLGSVSDFSLRESHASICIVRSTGSKFTNQCKFLFSTDGSHAAALAFVVLITMLRRKLDIVNVVMISTTDGLLEQSYVDQYKEYMAKYQVPGQVFVKCIDRTKTSVPMGIVEAARENDADTLVLGISGYGKKKLGSVSEEICLRAHCTTIIIKDSYEVLSHSTAREMVGRR